MVLLKWLLSLTLITSFLISCDNGNSSAFTPTPTNDNSVDVVLESMISSAGVVPLDEPTITSVAKLELGRVLFFDKELSGNRNISCGTCHVPSLATGDGIPLSIGQFGTGSGADRVDNGIALFIARNSPVVGERAAGMMDILFWDGRVVDNEDGTFITPAGPDLLPGIENALAAVDMFPVTDRAEMRGQLGDPLNDPANELAAIPDSDLQGIWAALTARLLAIPEYVTLFQSAYPEVTDIADFNFTHVTNAMSEFQKSFTKFDTPFDLYIRGNRDALSEQQKRGALLFFGAANCSSCHSGPLLSDADFHNRVVPQLGPGKGDGPDGTFDFGRGRETGDTADNFKFRTPPLRNVALSGPWFHDGAFATLEGAIRHELDPVGSALTYDPTQLALAFSLQYRESQTDDIVDASDPTETAPLFLTDSQVEDLVAFLNALTSPSAANFDSETPATVPSGLPVAD